MRRILKVAQREYVETVKTKTFVIGILMTPVIIGGIIFFTDRISRGKTGPRPPVKVAVTCLSKDLSDPIKASFDEHNKSHPERRFLLQELQTEKNSEAVEKEGKSRLRRGQVDAYVVLDKDILEGEGKIRFYTYKPKPANLDAFWTIENLFSRAVVSRRYEIEELDQKLLDELRNVPVERVEIGSADDKEHVQSKGETMARMMVPFFFMYLIFMGMVGTGQQMLSSIIEEKNSRIIDRKSVV